MASVSEVTEKLKLFVEAGKTVLDYFGQERMSIQMFKDEVSHLNGKKDELLQRNVEIENANEELRRQGEAILTKAQAEADSILAIARENLVAASRDRDAAKLELADAQKKSYLADKNQGSLVAA